VPIILTLGLNILTLWLNILTLWLNILTLWLRILSLVLIRIVYLTVHVFVNKIRNFVFCILGPISDYKLIKFYPA